MLEPDDIEITGIDHDYNSNSPRSDEAKHVT